MQKSRLTVFFEAPFWVAVYERTSNGKLEVCKITFGAEPKDYEVYDYFLTHWHTLKFSAPITITDTLDVKTNPKRMQRLIKKNLSSKGVGTKAQQALKEQQAEGKIARKRKSHQEKDAREQELYELKQKKRKEKHKGR